MLLSEHHQAVQEAVRDYVQEYLVPSRKLGE